MTWVTRRYAYQKLADKIEPAARVGTRDSWLWTAAWVLGVVATLGLLPLKVSLRKWLEGIACAVGPWQGYSRFLPELREETVAHECRHTTQTTWFGWALAPLTFFSRTVRAIVGFPIFLLVYYAIPPFVYLAPGRFYLELDADRAAWRLALREGWMTTGEVLVRAGRRAEALSTGLYIAWPRPWASAAYEKMARELVYEATR